MTSNRILKEQVKILSKIGDILEKAGIDLNDVGVHLYTSKEDEQMTIDRLRKVIFKIKNA